MRREEFLHEMELMYGRVQQQPLLFERYYAPRLHTPTGSIQQSPRKYLSMKRSNKKNRSFHRIIPSDGLDCEQNKNSQKLNKFSDNSD